MATTTTNFGWDIPQSTDLVKDGATAIAALGQDIDTALIDLKGGTTGQVLAKASGTDLDFTWATDASGIPATIFDAKGDIIAATAADTASRLAVGTNGHVLTADSTTATGLKWASAGGGGKVLQVVEGTNSSAVNITSSTMTDMVTVTITPTSATSKILLIASTAGRTIKSSADLALSYGRITRDSTDITGSFILNGIYIASYTDGERAAFTTMNYQVYDAPSSTSAITYRFQGSRDSAGTTLQVNYGSVAGRIVAMEIGA
jgi:hypothetical protein